MKVVIDIDENVFTRLFDNGMEDYAIVNDDLFAVANAIRNCTPLPKEHGKIVDIGRIDEDKMEQDNPIICITTNNEYIEAVSLDYLNNLPAIIEADKESDENGISD